MAPMRAAARWFVALVLCAAFAAAGTQPVWATDPSPAAPAASADVAASSTGFASTPAPEPLIYIGPGAAMAGSTVLNAIAPSPSPAAWRLPSRAVAESSPALHASRLSPHLRSIPLLI